MVKTTDLGAVTAYAIAVQHGFVGTEEEWIQSLLVNKEMQDNFKVWLNNLTQDLNVDTYLAEYKMKTWAEAGTKSVRFTATGYSYDRGDVINVFIDGKRAWMLSDAIDDPDVEIPDELSNWDYSLSFRGGTFEVDFKDTSKYKEVFIQVLKSAIGFSEGGLEDGDNKLY